MARGAMRLEMAAVGSSAGEGEDSSARGGNLPMLPSLERNSVIARLYERAGSTEAEAAAPCDAGELSGFRWSGTLLETGPGFVLQCSKRGSDVQELALRTLPGLCDTHVLCTPHTLAAAGSFPAAQASACTRGACMRTGAAPGPTAAPGAAMAAALAANESSVADVLRLSRVSIASSGVASCEEVDADHMCPICMVRTSSN